jgi:CDP-diglyceride synthetase
VTRTDLPATRPEWTGPATGQVRITGAEPAGEVTGELPVVSREDETGLDAGPVDGDGDVVGQTGLFDERTGEHPAVRLTDEPGASEGEGGAVHPVRPGQTAVPAGTPTELPHWTEPPTGQVPAVLSRDSGDEATGPQVAAPSWREEDADWVAHDEEFDPAMYAADDDEVALGSLDETDRTDADRRPWEFDLESSPHPSGPVKRVSAATDDPASTSDPITEPTAVVTPTSAPQARAGEEPPVDAGHGKAPEPTTAIPSAAVAALAAERAGGDRPGSATPTAHDGPGDDEPFADKPLPTGSARLGRARRAGLLPARLRAKRPTDVDAVVDTPLAAEPPGASVTEVPGAGRKRVGVAGLAAADRTAERAHGAAKEAKKAKAAGTGATAGAGPGTGATAGAEAAVAVATSTASRRLSLRRPRADGPSPEAVVAEVEGPTGGGPPARRKPRRPAVDPNRPGAGGSSIGIRVGTGIAVAVVALLAFKLGSVPSVVLSAIVVTFAAGECFGVLRGAGYHPASLLGLVGTVSLMVGAYAKGVAALPLILVLICVFTLIWYLFGIERGSPVAGTAATLLTVGWVSLLGAYAGLLLSPSSFPDRHGIAFLLGAIIATVANDVGALVIGGWLGSRPLAPTISPNKTWEGLFGGAVFSILFSTVVVGSIHPWSASNAALLGVVVAVVAPLGDLCESLLKRDLGLKDMGTLLPGHGGVLDRVDALLFVLPATYYLVRALNIA